MPTINLPNNIIVTWGNLPVTSLEPITVTGVPFAGGSFTATLNDVGVSFGSGGGLLVTLTDSNGNAITGGPYQNPSNQVITLSLSAGQLATLNSGGTQNWQVTLNYTSGGKPIGITDTTSLSITNMALLLVSGTPPPPAPPSGGTAQGGGGGPVGTGTSNPVVSYTVSAQSLPLTCFDLTPVVITITLLDGNNNPANAPLGGQQFTLSDGAGLGLFSPSPTITSPAGYAIYQAIYSNVERGNFAVTVSPGVGPLLNQNPLVVTAGVLAAPTDALEFRNVTRPRLRDAIRRRLGIAPPLDRGLGLAGEEPVGYPRPDNASLNAAIGSVMAQLSRETRGVGGETGGYVSVSVPATSASGPQAISLTGLISNGYQPNWVMNALDTIYRVVYQDNGGSTRQLLATERMPAEVRPDTPPSVPYLFWYRGDGQLWIWPGCASGGTLQITGAGMPLSFSGDTDVLSNVPLAFVDAVVWGCVRLICEQFADEPYFAVRYPLARERSEEALSQWRVLGRGGGAVEAYRSVQFLTNRGQLYRHGVAIKRRP
jgi:hypothetical protein